jgi:4-hydroxybenzoate polyprenyltransferase
MVPTLANWNDPYVLALRYLFPSVVIASSNWLAFLAWGLTMAAYSQKMDLGVYFKSLGWCLFSAWIVRSSACTVNDMADKDMDAGVGKHAQRFF